MSEFVTWWVLPSLIVLLISIKIERAESRNCPSEYGSHDWITALVISIVYPLGIVFIFCFHIWPALIKERGK